MISLYVWYTCMVHLGGSWCAVPCRGERPSGSGGVLKDLAWTGELEFSGAGNSCLLSEFPLNPTITINWIWYEFYKNLTHLLLHDDIKIIHTLLHIICFTTLPFVHTVLKFLLSKLFLLFYTLFISLLIAFIALRYFLPIGEVKSYGSG